MTAKWVISQGATKPNIPSYLFLVFDDGTMINSTLGSLDSDDCRVRDGDIKIPPQDTVDGSNWMGNVILLSFARSTGDVNEDTLVIRPRADPYGSSRHLGGYLVHTP